MLLADKCQHHQIVFCPENKLQKKRENRSSPLNQIPQMCVQKALQLNPAATVFINHPAIANRMGGQGAKIAFVCPGG